MRCNNVKENICKFSEYIKKNPITFDIESDTPCLETLWWQYSGIYPIHNEQTKVQQAAIREKLSGNGSVDVDEMLDLIGSLCSEYEQLAFTAGMKLGAQLIVELIHDAANNNC